MWNRERGDREAKGRRELGTGACTLPDAGSTGVAWRERELPGPEAEGGSRGSICSFGSVRVLDRGSVGVVLLPPWTVSCHIVAVRSELRGPGAITLCFQVRGLAMLQALYRLVVNGPVINLYTQSQQLIVSWERAELDKCAYCKATGAREGRRSLYIFILSPGVSSPWSRNLLTKA